MIGAAAGVAAVLVVIAVSLHRHERKKKEKERAYWVMAAVSLLLTVAAWFAVVAFTPKLGTVWAYTASGAGLVLLLSVAASSGIAYYHHLRHREHFHTHGTPAIGMVLAVSSALTVLNIRHVSGHAVSAVAGSWHGAGTAFTQVNAGKLGKVTPAAVTTGSHGVILAIAIIIALLVLIKVARQFGDRKKKPGGAPGSAPRELGR